MFFIKVTLLRATFGSINQPEHQPHIVRMTMGAIIQNAETVSDFGEWGFQDGSSMHFS